MHIYNLRGQAVNGVKMVLFLKLIIVLECILIIEENSIVYAEAQTLGLDYVTITTEAKYLINFTRSIKRFVLSCHYNKSRSFYSKQNI